MSRSAAAAPTTIKSGNVFKKNVIFMAYSTLKNVIFEVELYRKNVILLKEIVDVNF